MLNRVREGLSWLFGQIEKKPVANDKNVNPDSQFAEVRRALIERVSKLEAKPPTVWTVLIDEKRGKLDLLEMKAEEVAEATAKFGKNATSKTFEEKSKAIEFARESVSSMVSWPDVKERYWYLENVEKLVDQARGWHVRVCWDVRKWIRARRIQEAKAGVSNAKWALLAAERRLADAQPLPVEYEDGKDIER